VPWPPEDGGGGGRPSLPFGWKPPSWIPIGILTGLIVTVITTLIVFGGGGDSSISDQPTAVVATPGPTLPAVALPPTATQAVAQPPTEPPAIVPPTEEPTTVTLPPTEAPVPPTTVPPTIQTIETTSTNTLKSYFACLQVFIDNNPPIGTVFNNVGSWTMTRISATQATIMTAGGFNGTLDIQSRTLVGDRFQDGIHYHKELVWSEDFTSATGTTQIITTISGVDCIMTFEEIVNTATPWLF
jgi:hypothetical protein